MHCAICDREDDLITFDKVRGVFSDCTACQAVIEETLAEFEEPEIESQPSVDNTELRRGGSVHCEGEQPKRDTSRPFCETYILPTGA